MNQQNEGVKYVAQCSTNVQGKPSSSSLPPPLSSLSSTQPPQTLTSHILKEEKLKTEESHTSSMLSTSTSTSTSSSITSNVNTITKEKKRVHSEEVSDFFPPSKSQKTFAKLHPTHSPVDSSANIEVINEINHNHLRIRFNLNEICVGFV
jgi:hypothetical protein